MWLQSVSQAVSAAPGADSGLPALWQPVLALLLAAALSYLLLRLLRAARPAHGLGGETLRVLARLPLSESHTVYVISAAGRYLLIGGSPGGLTLLTEMEPGKVDELLGREAAAQAGRGWHRLLGRKEAS